MQASHALEQIDLINEQAIPLIALVRAPAINKNPAEAGSVYSQLVFGE
jgi:hypothetical protein